jgi:shikimate dehydrogenase
MAKPTEADLLVNATSVGLNPAITEDHALRELGLSTVDCRLSTVVDLVYRADGSDPPVTSWARQTNAKTIDGLEILVRQGARSFQLWTGRGAPIDAMRAAVREKNREDP